MTFCITPTGDVYLDQQLIPDVISAEIKKIDPIEGAEVILHIHADWVKVDYGMN